MSVLDVPVPGSGVLRPVVGSGTRLYALLTDCGTAAAETALCGAHLSHPHQRAVLAACSADGAGWHLLGWVDCSGNDALACVVCGAVSG